MPDIVIKDQAIPKETADAAFGSLDEEVHRKQMEGALKADKGTSVGLEWTGEALDAFRAYENAFKANSMLIAPIQSLRNKSIEGKLNISRPIVYSEVSNPPKRFISGVGRGIMGIIALGTLQLPKIGNNDPCMIESGSVAYYRDSTPIEFRACKGRGILFYIS